MSEFDQPLASHMVAPVHVLSPTERLSSAARKLSQLGISALPVVDSRRRLTGVLERGDLLRVGRLRARPEPGEGRFWWPDISVAECMQTSVPVAPQDRTLRQCAQRMLERGLHRLYVLADDELVGVVSTRELMRAVQQAQLATPIAALAAAPAARLAATETLAVACARLAASPEQALLVLDGQTPVGLFTRAELRACLEVDPAQAVGPYADDSLIVLDAGASAASAAERALAARVRYIVSRTEPDAGSAAAPHDGYGIVSGLSFASCICGGTARAPAAGLPTLDVPPVPPPRPVEERAAEVGAPPAPPVASPRELTRAEAALPAAAPASERSVEHGPAAPPGSREPQRGWSPGGEPR